MESVVFHQLATQLVKILLGKLAVGGFTQTETKVKHSLLSFSIVKKLHTALLSLLTWVECIYLTSELMVYSIVIGLQNYFFKERIIPKRAQSFPFNLIGITS